MGKITDLVSYQKWYDANTHYSNIHVTQQWGRIHWLLPFVCGDVLEIGCQDGGVTKLLASLDSVSSVTAIDITDEYVRRTKQNLETLGLQANVFRSYIEDLNPSTSYDTVIILEVLEHVLDEVSVIKKCHSLLKPGGSLLISVPDEDSLTGRPGIEPDHLRSFNRKTLCSLLQHLGEALLWVVNMYEGPNGWYLAHIVKGEKAIPTTYGRLPDGR